MLLASTAGFLMGGLILLLRATGMHGAEWQAAAVQAHGHIQIFGWGGLMVIGISLHFLPRLFSVPLSHPDWPKRILQAMSAGLVLRVLAQPELGRESADVVRVTAALGLALGSTLELVAGALAIGLIGSLFRSAPITSKRVPSTGVRLLIGTAFVSFEIALVLNWIGTLQASFQLRPLVSARIDSVSVILGLTGFLTAISFAMSARLLPLYVQTKLPREQLIRASAASLVAGLVLRSTGILIDAGVLVGIGLIFQATAWCGGIVALRVFESRRQLPRRQVRVLTDPLQLHLVTAYCWLLVAASFSIIEGMRDLGIAIWLAPLDAERHALGAGFVTVLILGVGAEMLPGLARSKLRWPSLRWATLILANLAALARVGPLLIHDLPQAWNYRS